MTFSRGIQNSRMIEHPLRKVPHERRVRQWAYLPVEPEMHAGDRGEFQPFQPDDFGDRPCFTEQFADQPRRHRQHNGARGERRSVPQNDPSDPAIRDGDSRHTRPGPDFSSDASRPVLQRFFVQFSQRARRDQHFPRGAVVAENRRRTLCGRPPR